jgi:hypothetical protein
MGQSFFLKLPAFGRLEALEKFCFLNEELVLLMRFPSPDRNGILFLLSLSKKR